MYRIQFGSDGIRGEVGEWPFVSSGALRLGYALGRFVRRRSERPFVVIGRDTRPSGDELLYNLSTGLKEEEVNVANLGVMTTPGVAFLTRRLQADLGVVITASHSPYQYNGFKLMGVNGLRLQREEEIEIESLVNELSVEISTPKDNLGQQTDAEHLIQLYVRDHVESVKSLEGLSVVLDCANGAAAQIAPHVFERLQARVIPANCAVTGTSINYRCGSEYIRECPKDLLHIMQVHRADYGFGFDGDGDRLVVVDANGHLFDGNDLLFVLASHFRAQGVLNGGGIVTTNIANLGLEEALRRVGIDTVYARKGDKNLEAAMWAGGYRLGGEVGGNIIINDGYHTAADAIYTAIVLGEIIVQHPTMTLWDMVASFQRHAQVIKSFRVQAPLSPEQKLAIERCLRSREKELGEGSRILFWESTTEPDTIRFLVEGNSQNTQEEVSQMAEWLCKMI